MSFIRSISGLRATLGDDLTPSLVADYALGFAAILPPGPIVLGRDGRPSGLWIEHVVVGALRAAGRTVRVLGMATTPTVQLMTEHSDAVGGIAITASHNPAPWNGLKFLDEGGVFLDATANSKLWSAVDQRSFPLSADQQSGNLELVDDAAELHIDRVLDLDAVRSAPKANGERVVVDAVNCSGSFIVPALLEALGYTVIRLFADGSGVFPHVPEPISENLTQLGDAVREHAAAFGVAVDPDADRLVLFDETGTPIGEERTITLATEAVMALGTRGDVVVNYSTTRAVDDIAVEHGYVTHRAAVGEINVVRMMQRVNAVIGGEGSGGVIYPACHAGRDSIVGLGLISALLRHRNTTLGQACAKLPQYEMVKTKIDLPQGFDLESLRLSVVTSFSDATLSTDDGVHAAWPDRWVHVRASNTEPIMRIIAEAPSRDEANELVSRVRSLING
ncbi:MAG: phosphoglucosamine mutase [Ignavibacteria bacterium]|nr:phosphoglucosamine mutase [Ignavibacteria bacterium]MBK7411163.1 phosphoglucosamine mutase [Ignavibacteria bacterium]